MKHIHLYFNENEQKVGRRKTNTYRGQRWF